ncbi:MAG: hypothetical protein HC773_28610 [Scytonema sp. CRU_2_7]|nr:hypothetical protein [Scytonema sp. CRU_2_7]
MTDSKATDAALQVIQQAVWVLAQIASVQLPSECQYPEDSEVVKQAKRILWSNNQDILWSKEKNNTLTPLRLLFDQVQLSHNQNKQHSHNQNKQHSHNQNKQHSHNQNKQHRIIKINNIA